MFSRRIVLIDLGSEIDAQHIMVIKSVYFVLGWVFFALGVIGIFLPVMPTTPFMILALWGFSRSSDRFHNWLYNHRYFGPSLQMWNKHRVIPKIAKIMSLSFMSISFIYMVFFVPLAIAVKVLIAVLMLYGAWFILTKPSTPPKNESLTET